MNNFLDMKNYLFRLYKEAVERYPFSENEEDKEDVDYLNRISYMHDRIIELPYDTFTDFISLFTIYFYSGSQYIKNFSDQIEDYLTMILEKYGNDMNIHLNEVEENETSLSIEEDEKIEENVDEEDIDDEDEIYESIETKSKEEFIDEILNQENNYLIEMLEMFYDEELYYIDDDLLEKGIEEDEFLDWEILEACVSDKEVEKAFLKFHPNLREELTNYKIYLERKNALNKLTKVDIKNLAAFIELFAFAKTKFDSNDYLGSFLMEFLQNTEKKNKYLYKNICILILKYCYIKEIVKKTSEKEFFLEEPGFFIQQLNYSNQSPIDGDFVDLFLDFDISTLDQKYKKLTNKQKKIVEDFISLESLNTYGTSGEWIEITCDEQLNKYDYYLKKYGKYSWYSRLNEPEIKMAYIYFTEDKNKENNIPRLYITVDDSNNINYILGKGYDGNIEFDMLDILEDKVKQINEKDKHLEEISIIRKIGCINDKVDKNIDLSKDEIDILYDITTLTNDPDFYKYSRYKQLIVEKADKRKNLAIYYDCLENEVALNEDELNENTVVFGDNLMLSYVSTCNYPKLRVVFGDLFASVLNNAEGLKSLEIVNGILSFESLESSKGLENLIYVKENAYFEMMDDTSYLNENLYVGGKTKIRRKEIEKYSVKKLGPKPNKGQQNK